MHINMVMESAAADRSSAMYVLFSDVWHFHGSDRKKTGICLDCLTQTGRFLLHVCVHSRHCVSIPGIQHCHVLAPEHLSFRYWPWQMYRWDWQMPPSLVQEASPLCLIEVLLVPVFTTFLLSGAALGLLLFSVVSFLFSLTLLSFLSALRDSSVLFSCFKAQLKRTSSRRDEKHREMLRTED